MDRTYFTCLITKLQRKCLSEKQVAEGREKGQGITGWIVLRRVCQEELFQDMAL